MEMSGLQVYCRTVEMGAKSVLKPKPCASQRETSAQARSSYGALSPPALLSASLLPLHFATLTLLPPPLRPSSNS